MPYKIEYIGTFYADILRVSEFLEEYPQKAARIFARLDRALSSLANMPMMYPVYNEVPEFRKISVEDYLVFYKVLNPEGIVEIHRFLYGRMDIPTQLWKP